MYPEVEVSEPKANFSPLTSSSMGAFGSHARPGSTAVPSSRVSSVPSPLNPTCSATVSVGPWRPFSSYAPGAGVSTQTDGSLVKNCPWKDDAPKRIDWISGSMS